MFLHTVIRSRLASSPNRTSNLEPRSLLVRPPGLVHSFALASPLLRSYAYVLRFPSSFQTKGCKFGLVVAPKRRRVPACNSLPIPLLLVFFIICFLFSACACVCIASATVSWMGAAVPLSRAFESFSARAYVRSAYRPQVRRRPLAIYMHTIRPVRSRNSDDLSLSVDVGVVALSNGFKFKSSDACPLRPGLRLRRRSLVTTNRCYRERPLSAARCLRRRCQ